MAIAKRIFLFLIVNMLIMGTISILVNVLGLSPYLQDKGINYKSLMIFCLIWGFGGAFISLLLSRVMAKWMMGVKVIDPDTAIGASRTLLQTVHRLAMQAGFSKMPEVGIYESPEVNAFATGPSRSRSLVAVSSGLLHQMKPQEVEGVLGHEIAHIANGDMVTMTLLQGVINAFVMFIARVAAFAISQGVKENSRFMVRMLTTIALDIVLGLLGSMVVAAFSRHREFHADQGGANLAGKGNMIAALKALQNSTNLIETKRAPSLATLKISGKRSGFLSLFSTHPPLEKRIERLSQIG